MSVIRVPPVPYEDWDLDALSVFSLGKKLPPSNMVGLLAHHPDLAKAFLTFNMHLLGNSALPKRTRELAILRVAWRQRCHYEWSAHVRIGRRNGVTDEEIEQVRAGAPTLINRAVDECATGGRLSDETYAALAAELDTRQLMDLVFTIGAYDMLAKACNTFGLKLDPDMADEGFDAPPDNAISS